MNNEWKTHPGILINKIPVKGIAGLLFVIGAMLPLLGVPLIRGMVPILVVGGAFAAALLYWWRHQTRW